MDRRTDRRTDRQTNREKLQMSQSEKFFLNTNESIKISYQKSHNLKKGMNNKKSHNKYCHEHLVIKKSM